MTENLILTGWYHPEYLAAAAALHGCCEKGVDVLGVSMAELVGTLERKGLDYKVVDILGVGLTENLDRLARVLLLLRKKGVRVRWFSGMPLPDETAAVLKQAGASFAEVWVNEADGLLAAVADGCPTLTGEEILRLRPLMAATEVALKDYGKGKLSAAAVWQLLQQAAGFAHRDHGDEAAYGDVVQALSRKLDVTQPLPLRFKHLLDDYQAGYSKELIGKSAASQVVRQRLTQAARYAAANVLILGETGTGKQIAAEFIHNNSSRNKGCFRHYNCAYGGNEDMVLDRLFGHEKGAFTDAKARRKGLFDDADGGTLFLDEIAEASPRLQAMLLTVVETRSFTRVGGSESERVKVDVRLVCATNQDLQQMVLDGKFRLDLYQRISEFPVRLVPLRDRKDDIAPMVKHYWHNMTGRLPTKRQIEALMGYDYPGNVRELVALLKQAKALDEEDFGKLLKDHAEFNAKLIGGLRQRREGVMPVVDYPDNQEELLCRHARSLYAKYGENQTAAAAAAGVSVNTFKKYLALEKSL